MNKDLRMKTAFTLAEVLITLGIIGIVSAMTIPTLINNYQKKVTVAKLQKVHAVLNQIARWAIANDSIKGYTTGQEITEEKTKAFFNEFIFSQLKSPKVISWGQDVYKDCGRINICYKLIDGKSYFDDTIATSFSRGQVFFSTDDNVFYHINMIAWDDDYDENGELIQHIPIYADAIDLVADINGSSGPNTLGKDVFLFVMDFDKGSAYPRYNAFTNAQINADCSSTGQGLTCAEKIRRDGWQIKDDYPW